MSALVAGFLQHPFQNSPRRLWIRYQFNYYHYSSRPSHSLQSSLDKCFHISSHLLLNRSRSFSLSMRLVIVKEVMWCWTCNKVMEHEVSNHPGSAGGWV